MDLNTKDVSELLNISEAAIQSWAASGKIPAYQLQGQYRFNRLEVENWMIEKNYHLESLKDSFLDKEEEVNQIRTSSGSNQYSLYRAVHKGGVLYNIPGNTKDEVIRNAMVEIAPRINSNADIMTNLLLDREKMMSTGLNNGFAVPHTRDFLLNTHYDHVSIVFPQKPIEYNSLDNQSVHTLFFLFASNHKRHLQLLAKIAHLASNSAYQHIFTDKPHREDILDAIKDWESRLNS